MQKRLTECISVRFCHLQNQGNLIIRRFLLLKISPFPCFYKFHPCSRVKNILRGKPTSVVSFCSNIFQLYVGCFTAICLCTLHQCSSFCNRCVFPCSLVIIIRDLCIGKITGKLCGSRSRPDNCCRKINCISDHQLYHAILIAFQVFRNGNNFWFVTDVCKLNNIPFQHNNRKYTLVISDRSAILTFYHYTHSWNAHKTVGCHYHPIKLNNGITNVFKLSF